MGTETPTALAVRVVASRALRALITASVVFAVLSVAVRVAQWRWPELVPDGAVRLFDLDGEQNLPTLYSVVLLALGAWLAGVVARVHGRTGRPDRRYWDGLALIFAALAFDEYVQVHEKAIDPVRSLLGIEGGLLYFAWVVPAIVLLAAFGLVYLRFLLQLPAVTRNRLVVAGVIYVGGALGMELFGGALIAAHGVETGTYLVIMHLEELMEMVGASLFVAALLHHLAEAAPQGWWVRVAATSSE